MRFRIGHYRARAMAVWIGVGTLLALAATLLCGAGREATIWGVYLMII